MITLTLFFRVLLALVLLAVSANLAAAAPGAVVVFNEIQYNPRGQAEDGEWVEFFNQQGIMVDVSGWRIDGLGYTFPTGTIIEPGSYLVVAKMPLAGELGPFTGSLDNGGERLRLYNQSERLMDEIEFADDAPWPAAADGSGVTLAKRKPHSDGGTAENWAASAQVGGTRGAVNFPGVGGPVPTDTVGLSVLADVWRYNESGSDLGATWAASAHAAGGDWKSGPGGIAYETSASLIIPIGTALSHPAFNSPFVVTYYFEREFDLTAAQLANVQTLNLRHGFDGGGIVYLNGVEVLRDDMPAGAVEAATLASSDSDTVDLSSDVPVSSGALVVGQNRISVEVHQGTLGSSDVVFGLELDAEIASDPPGTGPALVLNELPPSSGPSFWVELKNEGAAVIELSGIAISAGGDPLREYLLPAGQLVSGALLLIDEATLGFRPLDGEKLFVYGAGAGMVLDARQVTGRVRGRFGDGWFYPQGATPGAGNVFQFNDDIVISEIAYNPPGVGGVNSGNQWVEIANRGAAAVDLGGWQFDDGISFDFPAGTMLAPGEHACVARDPLLFNAAYPGARLLGEFSGSLSRSGERLHLRDANRNTVDAVRFYDGGAWAGDADGGGSTLELRDLDSANEIGGAWAASDESSHTGWQNYSYTESAATRRGPDSQWREFNMGLMSSGEILIDDVTVSTGKIDDPGFDDPGAWRLRGNHRHSEIIDDPDSPGNKVLRLVASGPTEHMHNQIETTLTGAISSAATYTISFRARWVAGSNQLHTRLYFNRCANVNVLDRPADPGTPSAPNSTAVANAGPTFAGLKHEPPVPPVGVSTTISVSAADPDGVTSMTLHYAVDSGAFQSIAMSSGGALYQAAIPGQSAGTVVQFYVEGTDALGATALFPKGGASSGAFYEVDDGTAATNGWHNFRVVLPPGDVAFQHTLTEVMSNDRLPCTVIDREGDIYYGCGVRLKSSQRGRLKTARVGYNIGFPADGLYRGSHGGVAIDRSEGQSPGQRELLFDMMISNSGGVLSRYYDFVKVLAPKDELTGGAVLQFGRYDETFLDSQFDSGGDGRLYEYELIYYPTSADGDGRKLPEPDLVSGVRPSNLGDDPEFYRWFFLNKINREADDFDPIIAYNKKMSQSGAAFEAGLEDVIDVDDWLRGMAYAVLSGAGDNAAANSQHNGLYYAKPDGRVMFLPHDMDFSFSTSRSITANAECAKLVGNPVRLRIYLGHLHDIISTTYNSSYMSMWSDHFSDLDPSPSQGWSADLSHCVSRSNNVLSQINSRIGSVAFDITTPSPQTVAASTVNVSGDGWVDVREIRIQGNAGSLPVTWTDGNSWQVTLPAAPGENVITLEAVNFSGEVVATDTITIDNTTPSEPASAANVAISELMYHPADGAGEEFIELMNIGSVLVDFTGARFTEGIDYVFSDSTTLVPGARLVIGASEFLNGTALANSGERIQLSGVGGAVIRDFTYDDELPWPTAADGDGYSLVLIAPESDPDHALASSWRTSSVPGGNPGSSDRIDFAGDPDADADGDGIKAFLEFALGSSDAAAGASEISVVATAGGVIFSYPRNIVADGVIFQIESSPDLLTWTAVSGELLGDALLGDGRVLVEVALDSLAPRLHVRLRVDGQ